MVDLTPFLPSLSPVQGKAVVARFDGGRLSSEGGLLALREIERRLSLADRLANCLVDPRAPERVVHRLVEIIRFRELTVVFEDALVWERALEPAEKLGGRIDLARSMHEGWRV